MFGIFTKENGKIALIALLAVFAYNRLGPRVGLPQA